MKTNGFNLFKKNGSSGKLMAFLATAVLLGEVGTHAATLTPATGGTNISAATAGGSYTSLTGPIYLEGSAGDVGSPGTIILNVPSGFVFNTNNSVTVRVNGDINTPVKNINNVADGSTITATVTSSNITINISSKSSTPNTLTWQGIQVRPTSSAPLASGNITKSAGASSIVGVTNGTTSFGTLTEVTAVVTISSGLTANNKVYDRTTTTSLNSNNVVLNGLAVGDTGTVQLSTNGYVANFANALVGTGKSVTVSGLTLTGGNSASYTLTQPTNLTANITARPLTVTAAANTKTYDGNTSAAAIPTITSGALQTGDTASFTESYADANVGAGKTLTATGVVSDGNSGNNYSYTFVANSSGVINPQATIILRHTGLNGTKVLKSVLDAKAVGTTISSIAATSAGGAKVTNSGSYVFYSPITAINTNDTFTYVAGGATGVVNVNIDPADQARNLNLSTTTNNFSGTFNG
ncbi:MAG: YDG domain-containing protein, partial [Verrucomicrobiota bacterium]